MRQSFVVLFFLIAGAAAYSQTSGLDPRGYLQNEVLPVVPKVELSTVPTAQEVTDALIYAERGRLDPALVMQSIIECGDKAIPALSEVISNDSLFGSHTRFNAEMQNDDPTTKRWPHASKVLAVQALEGIGSKKSFDEILKLLRSNIDPQICGTCIASLGMSYHEFVVNSKSVPDSSTIRVLLLFSCDTTSIEWAGKRTGELASEGLSLWLDWPLKGKLGQPKSLKVNPGKTSSAGEVLANWWEVSKSRFRWNEGSAKYSRP